MKKTTPPICPTFNAECIVYSVPRVVGYIGACKRVKRSVQFTGKLKHWVFKMYGFGDTVDLVYAMGLHEGDTVYIKGSRSGKHDVVIEKITKRRETLFKVNYRTPLVYYDSWNGEMERSEKHL